MSEERNPHILVDTYVQDSQPPGLASEKRNICAKINKMRKMRGKSNAFIFTDPHVSTATSSMEL